MKNKFLLYLVFLIIINGCVGTSSQGLFGTGVSIAKKRNPNSMFYKGVNEVDFPCNIQYTKQWVIYDKIDPEYTPDWHAIKWTHQEQ